MKKKIDNDKLWLNAILTHFLMMGEFPYFDIILSLLQHT